MPEPLKAYALHKEHAVVHTASIDVKIMRLDKKQVTMSVFRQLDEESIFMADGSLRGLPWGRVRYTWKENRKGTAFHVVWQDGNRIKRSPVPHDFPEDVFSMNLEDIKEKVTDWLFDGRELVDTILPHSRPAKVWKRDDGWFASHSYQVGGIYRQGRVLNEYGEQLIDVVLNKLEEHRLSMQRIDQLFIAV